MADQADVVYDFKRGFKLASRQPMDMKPNMAEIANRKPGMSAASGPTTTEFSGMLYNGGGLSPEILSVFTDLVFNDAATPWERKWSARCNGGGAFDPVLVETSFLRKLGMGTVAGHRGQVGAESLVRYGDPTIDRQSGWLSGDGLVFVWDVNDPTLPPGQFIFGMPQVTYDVLTTVDGQVLAIFGTIDREALVDANWVINLVLAPLIAPVLVQMASGAARICTGLLARWEASAARSFLAGPTRNLAAKASELDFEVLSEGAPIPGSSVPESMRLRVGKREFNISRNASKIEESSGQPIGPATKHMAEDVKGGPWNDLRLKKGRLINDTNQSNIWLQQSKVDFPISSLASGLQVAEREIMKKSMLAVEGSSGVFKVMVEGWEFMIDTNKMPWVVYHLVIR